MTLCGLLRGYQHFRQTLCLHFQSGTNIYSVDGESVFQDFGTAYEIRRFHGLEDSMYASISELSSAAVFFFPFPSFCGHKAEPWYIGISSRLLGMQSRQEPQSDGALFRNMTVVWLYWSQDPQRRLEPLYENSNLRT